MTRTERDRIRWRCRRGMLELDLVLQAFVERHLAALDDGKIDALNAMLMRPDPELLDLVMGRGEGRSAGERAILALMRTDPSPSVSLTPDLSPGGREEIRVPLLPPGEGSGMRERGEIRGANG